MNLHWYNNWESIGAFALLIGLVVIVGLISAIGTRAYRPVIGFGGLGAFIGLMAGLSQTPVVAAVLPAVLTFLGGITAYLFATQHESRAITGSLLISFSVLLIAGVYLGANLRVTEVPVFTNSETQTESDSPNESVPATDSQNVLNVELSGTIESTGAFDQPELEGGTTEVTASTSTRCLTCLEGSTQKIQLVVKFNQDVANFQFLEIGTATSFSGTVSGGAVLSYSGDLIEIRWPIELKRDALSLDAYHITAEGMSQLEAEMTPGVLESQFCIRISPDGSEACL